MQTARLQLEQPMDARTPKQPAPSTVGRHEHRLLDRRYRCNAPLWKREGRGEGGSDLQGGCADGDVGYFGERAKL
jgi:hypothetical protein